MNKMNPIISVLLLLTAACSQFSATPTPTPAPELPIAQALQETLDEGLVSYEGQGLSAAVIVPGYQPWVGVSGISHQETPIRADTLFSAGSITKNFTAVNILLLAEEGLLDLEDPIGKWLPDYPNIDRTITVRHLLNHTAGIHNFTNRQAYWNTLFSSPDLVDTPDEILQGFVLKPSFEKGTSWEYSNSGYLLLRLIIEEVSGENILTEHQARIFGPFGLESIRLAGEEPLVGTVAHGWWDVDRDGAYEDLTAYGVDAYYGGLKGGVFTTAEDLARWSHALFFERSVLSAASYEEMFQAVTATEDEPLVEAYGLGVVRFNPELFNGLEIWGHGGNAPGYAAGMLYLPDYGISLAIMDNTERGDAMFTINQLLSLLTANLPPIR